MKYMLLVYGDENALNQADREHCYEESIQLCNDLRDSGNFISASPLQSTRTATSIRVREGKKLVTDGPFAETKEQLGGFYLVDAKDLDQAIAIAERIPPARWGTIEVRPIVELPGAPDSAR